MPVQDALARFAPPELVEEVLAFLDRKLAAPTGAPPVPAQLSDPPPETGAAAAPRPSTMADGPEMRGGEADAPSLAQIGALLEVLAGQLLAARQAIDHFRHSPLLRDGAAGSVDRPIGDVRAFLDDVRARGFQPRGLVDVGANVGDWTRMATAVWPGLPCLLIEPQREMVESLAALADRPGCHFVNAGAGARAGELVQTIWEDLGGSSFLPPTDEAQLRSGRQRRTPIVTLDGLLTGVARGFEPDLVKLDIQGFELEALQGASSLFGSTELFIMEISLFEFMPRQPVLREVIGFMAGRGYEVYDITEYGRRPHDGALGQVDMAFVKTAGLFRQTNAW